MAHEMIVDVQEMPHVEVREAFEALHHALVNLIAALATQSPAYPCWVAQDLDHEEEAARSHRDTILWSYQQLYYRYPRQNEELDRREVIHRTGFLATSPATLPLAIEVNAQKTRFYAAMQTIKAQHRSQVAQIVQRAFAERHPSQAEALRKAGLGDLHLVQTYRHIPIITVPPRRIGFTWATQNKIVTPVTHAQAYEILEYANAGDTAFQTLEAIPQNHRIAMVRTQSQHVRANIVYPDYCPDDRRLYPPIMPASLPILFPSEDMKTPLYTPVTHAKPKAASDRLTRKDNRVDFSNPLLRDEEGTTGLYPYLEQPEAPPAKSTLRTKNPVKYFQWGQN
jgi:hypothetical protein